MVGTAALEGLLEAGIEVLALYTYAQAPDETWFEAPAALARRHGIPVYQEPDFNADHVYERIRAQAPDFLLSFYFREMIQARVLDLPRLGAFNVHGSMLPKYRGRAPINWVLVHGEASTGITFHRMTPKPDDGDIMAQTALPIAWDETALSLTQRSADAARTLVPQVLRDLIAGTLHGTSQRILGPSSYYGGRKPADSALSFDMNVHTAFNQIRAVADPWPNAFLTLNGSVVHIPWALPAAGSCQPGHFKREQEGVLLGFRDGALRIHALRVGGLRIERPTEHAEILRNLGLPEDLANINS